VCDVLEDLKSYSGKQIAIRGEMFFGYHGFGLIDEACDAQVPDPQRAGLPRALRTIYVGSPPDLHGTPYPSADPRSVDYLDGLSTLLLNTYWTKDPVMEPPVEVSATLVGGFVADAPRPEGQPNGPVLYVVAVRDLSVNGLASALPNSNDRTKD
jgi:hypothetical protein